MRLLLAIVLTVILSLIAEMFLPWWSLAVVAFLVTLVLRLRSGQAFLAGFLGIFILWFVGAFVRDVQNDHILSLRMSELFKLSGSLVFMLVGALIGAIVGGLAGWSGATVSRLFAK